MAARWPPVGLRLLCAASLPLGTTALFPTITITGLSFSWLKKKVNGKEDSVIYTREPCECDSNTYLVFGVGLRG